MISTTTTTTRKQKKKKRGEGQHQDDRRRRISLTNNLASAQAGWTIPIMPTFVLIMCIMPRCIPPESQGWRESRSPPTPPRGRPTSHTPPSLMNFSFCWTFPFPFHEGRHERNAITIELGKKRKAFFGLKEKISKKTFRYYIYILHCKSGTADPLLLEKLLPLREFSLFIRYVFIRPFPLILTLDLCSQEY